MPRQIRAIMAVQASYSKIYFAPSAR